MGFAHRAKMYWNMILKSPQFVPFDANLTHFEPKPALSEGESVKPIRSHLSASCVDLDECWDDDDKTRYVGQVYI